MRIRISRHALGILQIENRQCDKRCKKSDKDKQAVKVITMNSKSASDYHIYNCVDLLHYRLQRINMCTKQHNNSLMKQLLWLSVPQSQLK